MYPNEAFCICLGRKAGDTFWVEDLFIPPDQVHVATPDTVCQAAAASVYLDWWREAADDAKELGLEIIGDIHSHPYNHNEELMAHPSEIDWDCTLAAGFQGILAIQKNKKGRFWSRLRFWPARADTTVVVE